MRVSEILHNNNLVYCKTVTLFSTAFVFSTYSIFGRTLCTAARYESSFTQAWTRSQFAIASISQERSRDIEEDRSFYAVPTDRRYWNVVWINRILYFVKRDADRLEVLGLLSIFKRKSNHAVPAECSQLMRKVITFVSEREKLCFCNG